MLVPASQSVRFASAVNFGRLSGVMIVAPLTTLGRMKWPLRLLAQKSCSKPQAAPNGCRPNIVSSLCYLMACLLAGAVLTFASALATVSAEQSAPYEEFRKTSAILRAHARIILAQAEQTNRGTQRHPEGTSDYNKKNYAQLMDVHAYAFAQESGGPTKKQHLAMPPASFFGAMLLTLAVFLVGYSVIRMLKLNFPRSRTFREWFLSGFWIFPPSVDRKLIVRNRVAWVIVVFVTYVIVTSIFIG